MCRMRMLLSLVTIITGLLHVAQAGIPGFLGVGGRGGGASLNGATFTFLPQDPVFSGVSSVTGKALQVDIDKLTISASHGTLAFSPQGINFTRGHGIWSTEMFDERIETKRNGVPVVQMTASERLGLFSFKYHGQGQFSDILLDKATLAPVTSTICVADRKAVGLSKRDTESCMQESGRLQLTLSQVLEQIAKVLVSLSDTAGSQSEHLQKRLLQSYDEVINSVEKKLDDQVVVIKQSFQDYENWQAEQKENFKDFTAITDRMEEFRASLISNLQFVEERQDVIIGLVDDIGNKATANMTVFAANLTQYVNMTLSSLFDSVINSSISLLEDKSMQIATNMTLLQSELEVTDILMQELNSTSWQWQSETNQSLNDLNASLSMLNSSIQSALLMEHANMVELISSSQMQLQSELESNWSSRHASLSDGMATLGSELTALASHHNVSHRALSNTLDALYQSFSTNLEINRNATHESLEKLRNASLDIKSMLEQRLELLNATFRSDIDILANNEETIRSALLTLDTEIKQNLELIVSNLSASMAHTNGIFAKVIRDMNSSLIDLHGNLTMLEVESLPKLLAEVAFNASTALDRGLLATREEWTAALNLLSEETRLNTSALHTMLTTTIATNIEALNTSLGEYDRQQREQLQGLRAEMVASDGAQNASLDSFKAQTDLALENILVLIVNETDSRKADQEKMNASFEQRVVSLGKTMEIAIDVLHEHMNSRASELLLDLSAAKEQSKEQFMNVSVSMEKMASDNNHSLNEMRNDWESALLNEVSERLVAINTLNASSIYGDGVLLATIESLNHTLQHQLHDMANRTTTEFSVVNNSHNVFAEAITARLLTSLATMDHALSANMTIVLDVHETAMKEAKKNHSSLVANLSATQQEWQALLLNTSQGIHTRLSNLSDSLLDLHSEQNATLWRELQSTRSALQANITTIANQMIFENDHIMALITDLEKFQNRSTIQGLEHTQRVNDSLLLRIANVSNAVAAVENASHSADQRIMEHVNNTRGHLVTLIASNNASIVDLSNRLAESSKNWSEQWKATNLTATQHFLALYDDIESVSIDLGAFRNSTATALASQNATTSAALMALKQNLTSALAVVEGVWLKTINASIATASATENQHFLQLQSSIGQLTNNMTATISSLSDRHGASFKDLQTNISVIKAEFAQQQSQLKQSIEGVAESVRLLSQNTSKALLQEQERRDQLFQAVQSQVDLSLKQNADRIYASEISMNISILQQQAVLTGHATQLSQLRDQVLALESQDHAFETTLHDVDKQLVAVATTVGEHDKKVVIINDQLTKVVTEQLPAVQVELGLSKASLAALQGAVDAMNVEIPVMRAQQTDMTRNLSSLIDRFDLEQETQRSRLQELRTQVLDKIDSQSSAVNSRLEVLTQQTTTDHQELSDTSRKVSMHSDKLVVFGEDIATLKKQSVSNEIMQTEVKVLQETVKDLKAQLTSQKESFDKEMSELRAVKDTTMSVLTQLQKQMEQQSVLIASMQLENANLRAICAERSQVDKLKDQVMNTQQGVMQQVANILQLVQQQQQHQQGKLL